MNDCRTCPRRADNDEAVAGPCCDDPAVIAEEAAAELVDAVTPLADWRGK